MARFPTLCVFSVLLGIVVLMAVSDTGTLAAPSPYRLRQVTLTAAAGLEGRRINGPSLLRLPSWLPKDVRPYRVKPNGRVKYAKWYLYFGEHGAKNIFMAWCEDNKPGPDSKWHPYRRDGETASHTPVLELDDTSTASFATVFFQKDPDVGSPDVFLEPKSQRILMYIHAATACAQPTSGDAFVLTNQDDRLYGLSRGGKLWRAPETHPYTPRLGEPAFTAVWEGLYLKGGHRQLKNWVKTAFTDDKAKINHLGLAFVQPRLLEVLFNVKYKGSNNARNGRIYRAFFDISDANWKKWMFLTNADGSLLLQTVVSPDLLAAEGAPADAVYATSADVYVWNRGSGRCKRYLSLAFGDSNTGEGRIAVFELKRGGAQCIENEHPFTVEMLAFVEHMADPPLVDGDGNLVLVSP